MKTKFINPTFYYLLIIFISILLIYNIFSLINKFDLIILIPILIQTLLLYLIISKNKFAKIAIKIWTIIFLIVGSSFQIIGKILLLISYGFLEEKIIEFISILPILIIGILILVFTNKTVKVI